MSIMGWLIFLFILVNVIFTAIRQPAVSYKYAAELGKTTIESAKWCWDRLVDIANWVIEGINNRQKINVTAKDINE